MKEKYGKAQQTLGKILDAALECYTANGIGRTTLEEVAKAAGVGRTTLAVNLAVAMAGEQRQTVTLVDGSFQFGDIGVLLNLNPKNKSIVDVVSEPNQDEDLVDTTLISHSTGIKVLLAPPSPEMAGFVPMKSHVSAVSNGYPPACHLPCSAWASILPG